MICLNIDEDRWREQSTALSQMWQGEHKDKYSAKPNGINLALEWITL